MSLPSPSPSSPGQTLSLRYRQTVSSFISRATDPPTATERTDEHAAFGTRGDGKTQGAFGVMIVHAQRHHAAGGALPTKWLGAADTFQSHKVKTLESLTQPFWSGAWHLRDDGHLAVLKINGSDVVQLRLFGVEDQSGMDRLRAEAHGLWFEEPAPSSVLVQSSGLSESAWALGITSCRLPSYRQPKIMTLNYPDEDHWTWQRFVVRRHPGTDYVRIPPGEYASAEQRAEWERALANRPDMLRRLLRGEPGGLVLGEQVAIGFKYDVHVQTAIPEIHRDRPIWFGHDGGHTPATIIAQRDGALVRVVAALVSEHAGTRQHMRNLVLPWIGEHAPWLLDKDRDTHLVQAAYDPSMETGDQGDIDSEPARVLMQMLPGVYHAGPISWPGRNDPMLALLNTHELAIHAPWCGVLIKALHGAWHYPTGPDGKATRDLPKKPNHPWEDAGDAFCYLIARMSPSKPARDHRTPRKAANLAFDPYAYDRTPQRRPATIEFTP